MMRVLLVSTYELGRQPLYVASAAGRLRDAGHQVKAIDLAVDDFDAALVRWAEKVAISVPMHTAMRIGVEVAERIRSESPATTIAMFGLYAGMAGDRVVGNTVDAALVGEYEPALLEWVASPPSKQGIVIDLSVGPFVTPDRTLLPALDRYAHLVVGDEHHRVGVVEASHGCRHRCRHCPIPAVYDGVFRIVGLESLLADVAALKKAGASHITLADADFLNGPAHAMRVLDALGESYPDLTYDLTIKVEHLLGHQQLLPRLVERRVLFVTSAFESTNDVVLERLDKGHTAEDLERVMEVAGSVGLDLHPTWLPFTPWTTMDDVIDIFGFLERHDLFGISDPVQMSIRLLIPKGSLVCDLDDVGSILGPYDEAALSYRWASTDDRIDALQRRLAALAGAGADAGADSIETWRDMWSVVVEAAATTSERQLDRAIAQGATVGRPRMTEPWFC